MKVNITVKNNAQNPIILFSSFKLQIDKNQFNSSIGAML